MRKDELQRVYDELEHPLIPVLVDIERAGVRVDTAALAAQARPARRRSCRGWRRESTSSRAKSSTSTRRRSCRRCCSTGSGMRTETIRRTTKTKAQSTAFEVLEELALTHELPRLILEWRGLQKLKGTYIDALPTLVNPETGRVHTCFNQAVAATGRLSSSDPNLQNIPIRTEIGREIRRAFVAEPGHVLISADYSQIELRVLAHLAGEQTLIDAFSKRRGHPRPHRAQGVRRPQRARARTSCGGGRRSSTTRCSTASRRSRWRRTSASRGRRRRSSSTPTSRASPPSAASSTACWRGRARPASSRRCSAGGGWCRT